MASAQTYRCPVSATVGVIGGKWKPVILWILFQDRQRFGALRRMIPGITEKMLAQQLRELEADGVVHRQVFAVVPPKVEYSLTARGRALEGILKGMADWGQTQILAMQDTAR